MKNILKVLLYIALLIVIVFAGGMFYITRGLDSGSKLKIDVVKDVNFSKPEWTKQLFDKVIEEQSTNVDIISGATVTSKAYLKSIKDALKK